MNKQYEFFDSDDLEIIVKLKNVYGNELVYPANDRAEMFLNLTGKKTFSRTELEILKKVGYAVKFEAQKLECF